jgi:hypothetical protein
MRLTPAQVFMCALLGIELPRRQRDSLKELIKLGHDELVELTGKDFGYDLNAWHSHLRETNAGMYRWTNQHLRVSMLIKAAHTSAEWLMAVKELTEN